jgi:hypothetical protein
LRVGPGVPSHSVLHGGVGLQRHLDLEAIPEDRGDQRQLAGHHRLALDDGGEGEQLVHREAAILGCLHELRRELGAHLHHHARKHLLGRDPFGELVGVGEEVALDRGSGNLERLQEEGIVADPDHVVGPGQPLRLDGPRQLGESGAFLEEHGVVEHLAPFEQAQHGEGIGPLRHLVLAGPEASRPSLDEGEEGKAEGTSDDVGLVEASRDVEHTQVRWISMTRGPAATVGVAVTSHQI